MLLLSPCKLDPIAVVRPPPRPKEPNGLLFCVLNKLVVVAGFAANKFWFDVAIEPKGVDVGLVPKVFVGLVPKVFVVVGFEPKVFVFVVELVPKVLLATGFVPNPPNPPPNVAVVGAADEGVPKSVDVEPVLLAVAGGAPNENGAEVDGVENGADVVCPKENAIIE